MADQPTRARGKLAIQRAGGEVQLTVSCPDDYAAIALYDALCAAASKGCVTLEVQTEVPPAD